MSVKIATPTEDDLFRSRELTDSTYPMQSKAVKDSSRSDTKPLITLGANSNNTSVERPVSAENTPNLSFAKKRRSMDKSGSGSKAQRKRSFRSERKEVIKLPTKFLLGGNINDPLNLNSMNDEAINKILNAETPVSSPLPTPAHRKQVEVLIPPNINDPLNLNSGEDVNFDYFALKKNSAKKRKKHKRKKSIAGDGVNNNSTSINESVNEGAKDFSQVLSIDVSDNTKGTLDYSLSLNTKLKRVVDKIVSPAIPQHSPKPKRKRTMSECSRKPEGEGVSDSKHPRKEEIHKIRKQTSSTSVKAKQERPKFKNRDDKFIYGNYDRYYGKRNPEHEEDKRLTYFQPAWFKGKDVLDIGCNIGHVALSIAKDFEPRKITGMDIDGKLINVARKNVKHYLSKTAMAGKTVPVSLPLNYGPLAAPPVPGEDSKCVFPDNINFVQGNYVLERDELLELQKPEYDVILALSVTKWLHLNFGDAGLKRSFKRMYRQLKPGGKLILEPQSFASYKKKKKLTEAIYENYTSIELRPEQFPRYLLSPQVGFTKYERVETPYNKSQGFQRPIYVFTKCESSTMTPYGSEHLGVTPLMDIDCRHTPGFQSSSYTPNYDALNLLSDYCRTPSGLWEPVCKNTPSYSTANTPVHTTVTDSFKQSGSHCDDNTAPSSAISSPGHVTSSAKSSPGDRTPCSSQTSSSTCDTCMSDCSQNSCGDMQYERTDEKTPDT